MKKKQKVRENFRNEVFSRDNNKCKVCGSGGKLDAHHITDRNEMENGGYVKENGISLCEECHKKAEVWHSSGKTEFIDGYHPEQLYKMINSSYILAVTQSKKL